MKTESRKSNEFLVEKKCGSMYERWRQKETHR